LSNMDPCLRTNSFLADSSAHWIHWSTRDAFL
jgi:hypothetical protein